MKFRSDLGIVATLALFLATAGSGAAQNGYGRQLGDAEILDLAPGQFAGSYKGKLDLVIHLRPGGRVTGTADGKPQRGTWRVKGGELCLTVQFLILSKTKCGPVFFNGSRYFGMFNKRGKPRLVLRPLGGGTI